jgi:phosphatidylethanolamine/phosphatidyl-N-methylethanolamine N-methyltransferase
MRAGWIMMPAKPDPRALFFRHWLRHPLGIGAMLPSSLAVARAMARDLPLHRPGVVLELGGGTGVVTRTLLEAGCPPDRLVVVERAPELATVLRQRFPGIRVIEGDARDLSRLLAHHRVTRLAAVVSSLPIKWFSIADQRDVVTPCLDLLGEGGALLQLTNALVSPLDREALCLEGAEIERIWRQFPPVQLWRYWRGGEPATPTDGARRRSPRGPVAA